MASFKNNKQQQKKRGKGKKKKNSGGHNNNNNNDNDDDDDNNKKNNNNNNNNRKNRKRQSNNSKSNNLCITKNLSVYTHVQVIKGLPWYQFFRSMAAESVVVPPGIPSVTYPSSRTRDSRICEYSS